MIPRVKEDTMLRRGFLFTLLLAFGLAATSVPAVAQQPGVT
jgi:hypothetical protein